MIGDIACAPGHADAPIRLYDRATTWDQPTRRLAETPPLEVVAISHPSALLPRESSLDYAQQLLPLLRQLDQMDKGAWARAHVVFKPPPGRV